MDCPYQRDDNKCVDKLGHLGYHTLVQVEKPTPPRDLTRYTDWIKAGAGWLDPTRQLR